MILLSSFRDIVCEKLKNFQKVFENRRFSMISLKTLNKFIKGFVENRRFSGYFKFLHTISRKLLNGITSNLVHMKALDTNSVQKILEVLEKILNNFNRPQKKNPSQKLTFFDPR